MELFRKSSVNMEIRLYNKVHDYKKFENDKSLKQKSRSFPLEHVVYSVDEYMS
jgi:hypothetical protein